MEQDVLRNSVSSIGVNTDLSYNDTSMFEDLQALGDNTNLELMLAQSRYEMLLKRMIVKHIFIYGTPQF